jgi:hypothetical protein
MQIKHQIAGKQFGQGKGYEKNKRCIFGIPDDFSAQ